MTDRLTGEPLQGANVGIGGLSTDVETGFDLGLSDRTGPDPLFMDVLEVSVRGCAVDGGPV